MPLKFVKQLKGLKFSKSLLSSKNRKFYKIFEKSQVLKIYKTFEVQILQTLEKSGNLKNFAHFFRVICASGMPCFTRIRFLCYQEAQTGAISLPT